MNDSKPNEDLEKFRQELHAENVSRLKQQLVKERSWLLRIVPRFSLLTLLLLVMLFGLGAAYISLRISTAAIEKQKESELQFERSLAQADRWFLSNQLNIYPLPEVETLAICQRYTFHQTEYPKLLLQLDPTKNYVIHARQTDVASVEYSNPEQSMVITAVGPRERNRSMVVVRFVGSTENQKDPDYIFQGVLRCIVESHRLDSNKYVSYQRNEQTFLRSNRVEIQKSNELNEFAKLWNRRQSLNPQKPTELFRAVDSKSPQEQPTGLLLWIEEIEPEKIRTLPNRVLFLINEAN